jgi:hypothetical protein
MSDYPEQVLQRSRPLATRVPSDLYQQIEREAAELGVSVSDIARMRLKTGRAPRMEAK